MTRPNIVRADTIDLQDQEAPSAAEHHRPALQNGLAPHQRAEVHHVLNERSSEEHALADAWKMSDDLTEEPGTIDEAQQQHQTTEHRTADGAHHDMEGGSETEADDDMMDRISSSPSIDDGGYTLHSSPPPLSPCGVEWPERKSSLSPPPRDSPTPTRETFNESASSTPGSSPFLQTPQHLPLHVRRTGKVASRLLRDEGWSSSPFTSSPTHLPLIEIEDTDEPIFFPSEHHQQLGRYRPISEPDQDSLQDAGKDEGFFEDVETNKELSMDCRTLQYTPTSNALSHRSEDTDHGSCGHQEQGLTPVGTVESPFRQHTWNQSSVELSDAKLEQSPSLTSIGSVDLRDVLLPVDDPLLDTPPSPTDSTGSWATLPTTESDSLDHNTVDDDIDALFHTLDDRFIDSGWGGECLRETEDIDFEFVYALHTFVATVEGQANATKGDTMVLLDDSNSYWWLVRVVKDSSIGYLPAEHIETPTERLARLNKHRNIDLSQTMLSDNSEKTRNPLKKLRRRNNKAVQFAAPTYVEASDFDYSDEEEDTVVEGYTDGIQSNVVQQNGEHSEVAQNGDANVGQEEQPRASTPTRGSFDREQAATIPTDDPQLSPKLIDKTEAAPLKSRKTRNTDSFLKDDNTEPRRITITPGLLREEQLAKASTSSESARTESLENIVKQISPPEPLSKKDSKKEKEKDKKKEGFIKGLFKSKRKDKKAKDEGEVADEKSSTDLARESPIVSPLTSGRNSPGQEHSSVMSAMDSRAVETQSQPQSLDRSLDQEPESSNAVVAELAGTEAAHEMDSTDPQSVETLSAQQDKSIGGPLSPITNLLKRDESKPQKPAKAKRAKERVELDDFDSPSDEDEPNSFQEREGPDDDEGEERLSESPVDVGQNTYMHGTESIHIPTPSPDDQPELEDDTDDGLESMTSSPSIIEHPSEPAEGGKRGVPEDDDPTPKGPRSPDTVPTAQSTRGLSTDSTSSFPNRFSPATTVSQQSWSDSSLRAWLEDGSEIKDMMVIIHDKSGVVPVSDDHPLMAGLFTEQRKGVQNMMTELDGLLGSYLQRKGIAFS